MTGQREAVLLLFYSLCVGAVLGVVYDVFRIVRIALYGRKKFEKRKMILLPANEKEVENALKSEAKQGFPSPSFFLTFVCDIAFCVFSALTVTVMLFQFGDGRVRAFSLLGAFAGFAVYYFTVGRAVIFFSDKIIFAVKTVIKTVLKFTIYPVVKIIMRLGRKIRVSCDEKQRMKNTRKYIKRMLNQSQKSDLGEKQGNKNERS